MELKGRVALVTGGSHGIGRSIALALASGGAKVAVAARTSTRLEKVVAELVQRGSEAIAVRADVSEENEIRSMVSDVVGHFGALDILVNNAGFGIFGSAAELSTRDWDSMFAVNLRGLFLTTREALPHLRRKGEGAVVNIVSLAGKNFFKGGAGYAATKWGVLGFSKCLMLEERDNGVRVIAICPGSVDTHFFDNAERSPDRERILKPEDVAETVLAALQLPQHALLSELEIRPTNP
jgi:3-oxoacyl-[acyl-carrier protein] reductase